MTHVAERLIATAIRTTGRCQSVAVSGQKFAMKVTWHFVAPTVGSCCRKSIVYKRRLNLHLLSYIIHPGLVKFVTSTRSVVFIHSATRFSVGL